MFYLILGYKYVEAEILKGSHLYTVLVFVTLPFMCKIYVMIKGYSVIFNLIHVNFSNIHNDYLAVLFLHAYGTLHFVH